MAGVEALVSALQRLSTVL